MKILALETATDPGSIALWLDGRVVARDCPRELSNSASLLPVAEAVLREEGLGFSDLDGIAFGMGAATTFVLTVGAGTSYLIDHYLLQPFDLGYLRTLAFIVVIAAIVARAASVASAARAKTAASVRRAPSARRLSSRPPAMSRALSNSSSSDLLHY